ncbi:MAG: hypothetical protein NTW16_18365 [Bacteroidetes bacterium]|nr:hypothetical protein [Bacteroidota bacterium]
MKKVTLTLLALILFQVLAMAQYFGGIGRGDYAIFYTENVLVTATAGTVGPTGYATLKGAFDAINLGTHMGTITVKINSNITETATARLYQSGYAGALKVPGGSDYDSVLIYPTLPGIVISGDINGPLIDLNGADKVTIDGRVNRTGAKDLAIVNTSVYTGSDQFVSTIRLINSAQNNKVKYCTIKGCAQTKDAITSFPNSGVIHFSTSASGSGNSNNTVDHCDITAAGTTVRPYCMVYSYGSSSYKNVSDTISNCNIYNIFRNTGTSNGIYIASYSSDWAITGNNLYESTPVVPIGGSTYYFIMVDSPLGTNFTISDNYIGGTAADHTGIWTVNPAFNSVLDCMYLNVGGLPASSVQNNTIQGIAFNSAFGGPFYGINIIGGYVNVGTVTGNVIGSVAAPITIATSSATASSYGIFIASIGNVSVQHNTVCSIATATMAPYAGTGGHTLYGIIKGYAPGSTTISENVVGSTTVANSMMAGSTATDEQQDVFGILSMGIGATTINGNTISNLTNGTTNSTAATTGEIIGIYAVMGTNTVTNNTVDHLTIANANNSLTEPSVAGIRIAPFATSQTVTGNNVHDLSNTYDAFAGNITGIHLSLPNTAAHTVSRNFVHDLSAHASSSAANITGIDILSGVTTYSNNIISLGGNTNFNFYGINDHNSANSNIYMYYNTVYLSGISSLNSSYAYYCAAAGAIRNIRNNIFINARTLSDSKAPGSIVTNHYAIYFGTPGGTLLCDYNDYFVSANGGKLGYYGGDKTALPIVTGVTGNDDHSKADDPDFETPGGTTAESYQPSAASLLAKTGTGITTDYGGSITRSDINPSMGAWEYTVDPPPSPVEVFASEGTPEGGYNTLQEAFDWINQGFHGGIITIKINESTVETATAVLHESGYSAGKTPVGSSYTAVTVYPTAAGLSISGSIDGPLVDLHGADNVVIDGRVNQAGAKSLTIVNTYGVASVSPVSAIRFINSAENNKVKYCTVKASALNAFSGVILFSTAIASNGNSGNRIDNCDITQDVNRPYNMVISVGSSGYENKNDTVSNCNVYNCFKNDASSTGVCLIDNTTDWVINGNNFYETATVVPTGAFDYRYLYVVNPSGNNYTVSNNIIGGNAADHTGTLTINGASWHSFTGIYLEVGSTTASSVQNNTIKNMSYANIGTYAWIGIAVAEGKVNVGTLVGNTIGSSTGTGSILLNNSTANRVSYGIYAFQGEMTIQNNVIGSITTTGSATYAHSFCGIFNEGTATGPTIISNNVIGSTTTSNSINASSASASGAQTVYGILNQASGTITISGNTIAKMTNGTTNATALTYGSIQGINSSSGTNTITNNTVRDLTIANANNSTTNFASAIGICQTSTSAGQTISGNTIYNLSNTNSTAVTDYVTGMYYSGGTSGINTVSRNFIHSLSVSSSSNGAGIRGLQIDAGTATFANNIISLGSDLNADYSVNGIYENCPASNNPDYYFNTVYLGGNAGVGSQMTHSFISVSSTNLKNILNNIFINSRTGTTAKRQCAVRLQYMSGITGLTIDNNDYYAPNAGGVLGKKGPSTFYLTLEAWQGYTGQDSHSKALDPGFASAGGTTAASYLPSETTLIATTGTGVTTDFGGTITRSETYPSMSAWEYAVTPPCANPTSGGTITASQTGCLSLDPAELSGSLPGGAVGTLEYQWQSSIISDAAGFGEITGATNAAYDPGTLTATTWYKRLSKVTCLTTWPVAGESNVLEMTVQPTPTAGAIAAAQTICYGTGPALLTSTTAGGGSGTISYEWQNNSTGSYVNIGGATTATYQPPSLTATRSYQRRTVSTLNGNVCYSDYTTPVVITVRTVPVDFPILFL